jgi:hypothetical protein
VIVDNQLEPKHGQNEALARTISQIFLFRGLRVICSESKREMLTDRDPAESVDV